MLIVPLGIHFHRCQIFQKETAFSYGNWGLPTWALTMGLKARCPAGLPGMSSAFLLIAWTQPPHIPLWRLPNPKIKEIHPVLFKRVDKDLGCIGVAPSPYLMSHASRPPPPEAHPLAYHVWISSHLQVTQRWLGNSPSNLWTTWS